MMPLDGMTPGLMQGHVHQLNLSFSLTQKALKALKAQVHARHKYCSKVAGLIRHGFKGINAFTRTLLTQSTKICEVKKVVRKTGV